MLRLNNELNSDKGHCDNFSEGSWFQCQCFGTGNELLFKVKENGC